MGGISAIFGLGSRQQEKVTAAALERCQNGERPAGTPCRDQDMALSDLPPRLKDD